MTRIDSGVTELVNISTISTKDPTLVNISTISTKDPTLVNISTISKMNATLNSTTMVADTVDTSVAETEFLLKDLDDGMGGDGEDLKFSKNKTQIS